MLRGNLKPSSVSRSCQKFLESLESTGLKVNPSTRLVSSVWFCRYISRKIGGLSCRTDNALAEEDRMGAHSMNPLKGLLHKFENNVKNGLKQM